MSRRGSTSCGYYWSERPPLYPFLVTDISFSLRPLSFSSFCSPLTLRWLRYLWYSILRFIPLKMSLFYREQNPKKISTSDPGLRAISRPRRPIDVVHEIWDTGTLFVVCNTWHLYRLYRWKWMTLRTNDIFHEWSDRINNAHTSVIGISPVSFILPIYKLTISECWNPWNIIIFINLLKVKLGEFHILYIQQMSL